jgi:D-alanyl-D-alanine carboxypeptidase
MNKQETGAQLQELINTLEAKNRRIHGVALGVLLGDRSYRWCGGAGWADPAQRIPMHEDTLILLASVTKMYTATAAVVLAERGGLDLDAPLTQYLEADRISGIHQYKGVDHTARLRVSHLLAHTSGLPDYFMDRPRGGRSVYERLITEGDRPWHLDDVVSYVRECLPARFAPVDPSAPEARGHYSDTNYKLLGAVLEAATGHSLSEIFRDVLLAPQRLSRTHLYGQGHDPSEDVVARLFHGDRPLVLDRLLRSHGPEGGLVSTVDETVRFGKAVMTGAYFRREETLASMQKWNRIFFPFQYGFGLMRYRLPGWMSVGYAPELMGHSGSSGSFFYYAPELDLYMAGTVNQMTTRMAPFRLIMKVSQLVRKQRRLQPAPASI